MERVTSDDVKHVVIEHNITRLILDTCDRCHNTPYYQFQDGVVSFHPGCENLCNLVTRISSYEAVATSFNRLHPVERKKLWDTFLLSGEAVT